MLSKRCLKLQTELVDQLLPELLQLVQNGLINFNNSKQLDTLLRHLELSTLNDTFNVVPSITILHILFTLSIRAPSLNWSYDANRLDTFVPSEYMKQVNRRYDSVLYHELLQKRAVKILEKYVSISMNASNVASVTLYDRLVEVVSTFFLASHSRPSINRRIKDGNHNSNDPRDTLRPKSPSVHAVEVISDSEESDAIVDEDHSLLLPENSKVAERCVLSFTDLGTRTSGLGETAVLFRDMPHLLARVTPEPLDSDEPKPKRQRHLLIDQIQVFDDYLLFKRLQGIHQYNFWNLIRWCFWCADVSSQYQEFLFNSHQTKVHEIFDAYNDTLVTILGFCLLDVKNCSESSTCLTERLFGSLGRGVSVYDRAIEFIFTGLGIPSNDEPKPYYSRENILIKTDSSTHLSQCKERAIIDDNTTSMNLRLLLLRSLYSIDLKISEKDKIVSELMLDKIWLLPSVNLKKFLATTLERINTDPNKYDKSVSFNNMIMVTCIRFVEKMTDSKVCSEKACTGENILLLLESGRLFTSFIDNYLLECFDAFFEMWKKLIYLSGWLVEFILTKNKEMPPDTVETTLLKMAKVREDIQKIFYKDDQILKGGSSPSLEPEEEYFTPCLDHSDRCINVEDSFEKSSNSFNRVEKILEGDESVEEVTHNWTVDEVAKCLSLYDEYLCNTL